jgi:DNA-binding NarL/FixJ family response regulator
LLSSLHFQIIIDIIFFVTILILLRQLNKRIERDRPVIDESIVLEFKKLMTESQDFTNHFIGVVEENEQRLNKLSRQLDNKEKKLIILIEEAEALINKVGSQKTTIEKAYSDEERSKHIIQMIQEGRSREEVAKQLNVTEGEINLIMALEQIKAGTV